MNATRINPVDKAKELKDMYKTHDPFRLCRYLKIKVMFENLGHVIGFYQTAYGIRIIHINSEISQNKKRVACAHELGHAVLHYNLNKIFLDNENYFTDRGRLEMEADLFMIELLLMNTKCKKHFEYTGTALEIIERSINLPDKRLGKNYREKFKNRLKEHVKDSFL